jgi:hypothetical protein
MCLFYWGVASVWPLYHEALIGGVLQRWLSFWIDLQSPQRNSRALSDWPLGSWSPPLFLGTFNAAKKKLVPFPRSVPQHNPVSELYGQFLRPPGFASAVTCTVNCGTNQLNLPQVDSTKVVQTSQGWPMETGCTWAQFWVSKHISSRISIWILPVIHCFWFGYVHIVTVGMTSKTVS